MDSNVLFLKYEDMHRVSAGRASCRGPGAFCPTAPGNVAAGMTRAGGLASLRTPASGRRDSRVPGVPRILLASLQAALAHGTLPPPARLGPPGPFLGWAA